MFSGLFHDCFVGILSSYSRHEAVFFLDPDDLLVVHDDLFLPFQPHFNGPPAVFRFPVVKDFLHTKIVMKIPVRQIGAFQPSVISAAGYAGNGAQERNIFLQRSDDLELMAWP